MRRHRDEAGWYRDLLHPCTHVETMNASCSTFEFVQERTTSLPSSPWVLHLSVCVPHTHAHTRAHTRTHAHTRSQLRRNLTYTAFLLLFPFSRVSCPLLRLMYGALCRCSPLSPSLSVSLSLSLPFSLLSSPANSDEPRASSAASSPPARARALALALEVELAKNLT